MTKNIAAVTQVDNKDDGVSSQLSTTSLLVPNSATTTSNTEQNINLDEAIIEQQAGHLDTPYKYFIRRRQARIRAVLNPTPPTDSGDTRLETRNTQPIIPVENPIGTSTDDQNLVNKKMTNFLIY